MTVIPYSDCIRCYFDNNSQNGAKHVSSDVEVFFAYTKSLIPDLPYLKNFITNDEQLRADSFYSEADRHTYISCHALLRLILSERLNVTPSDLFFIKGSENKPGLPGNVAYFNISHTSEAFAIAFSRDFQVGIDVEKINQRIDTRSIIQNYFSECEHFYIGESEAEARDRFFLLWTRKEALLKAIGTGMINSLNQINVSELENFIKKEIFNDLPDCNVFNEYFVYSYKLQDHFLSTAIPSESLVRFHDLNDPHSLQLFLV